MAISLSLFCFGSPVCNCFLQSSALSVFDLCLLVFVFAASMFSGRYSFVSGTCSARIVRSSLRLAALGLWHVRLGVVGVCVCACLVGKLGS